MWECVSTKPGHDRLARDVDHPRALRHLTRRAAPTADDAVVADHDVGVLDDLVALHRDRRARRGARATPCGMSRGTRMTTVQLGAARSAASRSESSRALPAARRVLLQHLALRLDPAVEGAAAVQLVLEQRAAERPFHGLAVAAPGGELSADVGEPARRYGALLRILDRDDRRLAPDLRHGHDVHVVARLHERLSPAGLMRARSGASPFSWSRSTGAVTRRCWRWSVPSQRIDTRPLSPAHRKMRLVSLREVRLVLAPRGRDEGGGAPRGRQPHEIHRGALGAPARPRCAAARRPAHDDDAIAVRRPGGSLVRRALARELHRRRASGRAHLVQRTAVALPGDVARSMRRRATRPAAPPRRRSSSAAAVRRSAGPSRTAGRAR